MDDTRVKLDVVIQKLDDLQGTTKEQTKILRSHDLLLSEYNFQLEHHIKRTDLLETHVANHAKEDLTFHKLIESQLQPILVEKKAFGYLIKIVGVIGALAGSIAAIIKTLP